MDCRVQTRRSLQAAASDKGAEGRGKASIDRGAEFCQSGMKICKASLEGIASMIETPAEVNVVQGHSEGMILE